MYGPVMAVAIDDKPTHLLAIGSGLAAVGIPCMSYWYDRNASKLVPAATQHPYLRLLFMDLNLAELGGNPDPQNLAGVVMDVLKQIIVPEAGPYLLVFWTEVTGKIAAVKELIYERLEGVPPPLDIVELSKRAFLPTVKAERKGLDESLQELFAELSGRLSSLSTEVKKLISARSELCTVVGWEARATQAAARAVNEVVHHARIDENDKKQLGASMKRVLATVARAAVGQPRAEAEPERALDAGMAEILNDQFSLSVDEKQYRDAVRDALLADIKAKSTLKKSSATSAGLNTFFHVDQSVMATKTTERGVVFPAKPHFSEKLLGTTHKQLLTDHFVLKDKPAADIDKLEAEAELVLVEVGAECDHAQGHARTIRYLVAYQIPTQHIKLVKGTKGDLRHDALQLLGPWDINGGIYLLVSCRRFFTWQDTDPPAGKVKYRLRGSVVDKLLHHYSMLSSRPGIVEFRP
jgi:hypothetical protein